LISDTVAEMATYHQEHFIMQQIKLTQGKIAVLDDEDYQRLCHFKWFYRGERNGGPGYCCRHGKKPVDPTGTVYLHRAVMNPEAGLEVIFLNHDRLDCRKANLRAVTTEEARQHHRMRKDSQTGSKGVIRIGEDTWSAYVYRAGHAYHVGTYYTREQAERAYQAALVRENPDLHAAPAVVERQPMEPRGDRGEKCSASVA
jgi:hypothetical protein